MFKDRARVLDEDLAGRASTVGADALLAEIVLLERVPARRRLLLSPGRALLGLAAAAAAVAAIAPAMLSDSTISVAPQPSTSVSATAESTARQILLAAAVAVEKATASGDYWRTATVNQWMLTDPTRSYVLEGSRSLETWLAKRPGLQYWRIRQDVGVKPATPARRGGLAGCGGAHQLAIPQEHEDGKPVLRPVQATGGGGR